MLLQYQLPVLNLVICIAREEDKGIYWNFSINCKFVFVNIVGSYLFVWFRTLVILVLSSKLVVSQITIETQIKNISNHNS